MVLQVAPDVEALVATFLRTQADLVALGVGVGTALPAAPTFPFLTITRVGGAPHFPRWVDPARLQFDAWGADKASARLVAATAQVAMQTLSGLTTSLGTVTGVVEDSGLLWLPDRLVTPARPRYLFTNIVVTHPRVP